MNEKIELNVVSPWGEIKTGVWQKINFTKTQNTVYLVFEHELILGYPIMGMKTTQQDFYIENGMRCIWGQGNEFPINDWTLDEKSRNKIKEMQK